MYGYTIFNTSIAGLLLRGKVFLVIPASKCEEKACRQDRRTVFPDGTITLCRIWSALVWKHRQTAHLLPKENQ
jgi:hypothetical protein